MEECSRGRVVLSGEFLQRLSFFTQLVPLQTIFHPSLMTFEGRVETELKRLQLAAWFYSQHYGGVARDLESSALYSENKSASATRSGSAALIEAIRRRTMFTRKFVTLLRM